MQFDAFGHTKHLERHGFGPTEDWVWLDRVRLERHTVTTSEGADAQRFGYYDNGQLETIDDGVSQSTYTYDAGGWLARLKEASEDVVHKTCFKRRPDGTVFQVVDPNGAAWTETRSYSGNNPPPRPRSAPTRTHFVRSLIEGTSRMIFQPAR